MSRCAFLFALLMLAGCGAPAYQTQTLGGVDPGVAVLESSQTDRKVMFEATMKLVVSDFSQLEMELPKLVKEHEGYLAGASIDRTQGAHVSGKWIARIPVGRYEPFLDAISKLGVPNTLDQKSQHVTEEYVDLESRIANEKKLEARVLELLKRPEGEIKEVINLERELARIRGEIEKMEGRLRFLANHTAMTTVTIDAIEQKAYVPPQAPTLANRIAQSWSESLTMLRHCGEGIVVSVVFFLPWLVLAAVIATPMVWVRRRRRVSH